MLTSEQKQMSRHDNLSFRHVVGRSAGAQYDEAISWLDRCHDHDALQPVESSVIVHRLSRQGFTATGLIAEVSLAGYNAGRVKRHEATIAKTERKMINYMESTRIYGNAVALAHQDDPLIAAAIAKHCRVAADIVFEAIDGAQHELWFVDGDEAATLCASFNDVLYITDGHHRLAAAATLATSEGRTDDHIPAGVFAESELGLWAYARAITDPAVEPTEVIAELQGRFVLEASDLDVPRPTTPRQMGVRIAGRSYLMTIPQALVPADPYDRLDVNLLQDLVLAPLFDLANPRTDRRLDFIADTGDDAHDADSYDAWFLPHPTSVSDVMMVANTERSMPPKSTYFLPKLPSGLVIRPVDFD